MQISEMDLLRGRMARGGETEEFFAREIALWKRSPERLEQLTGAAYYRGDHDILRRRRTVIGPGGQLTEVENLPCHRIVDNQYARMVDQKARYLLGRPFCLTAAEPRLQAELNRRLGPAFRRQLLQLGEDALCCGIAWLSVAYNAAGELVFRSFPGHAILPFWADDAHTVLDAAVRLYRQEVWDGPVRRLVEKAEIFRRDGLYRYVLEDGNLIPDTEAGAHADYITLRTGETAQGWNWEKIPLIAFRYDRHETPLIRRVKSLQDGINSLLSSLQDNMQEDVRNTILVLKNYDGQNLGEFRYNLAAYGAVKVRDDGGVETLQVQVDAANYEAVLNLLKKALIENARGFDAKDERLEGNPNQMNIQSMYADIDLDAGGMELEFQAAMEQLLWFIRQDLRTRGAACDPDADASIIFNRDVLVNESEAIDNCVKSAGILSQKSILEQHPWVQDAEQELRRLRAGRE